MKESLKEKIKNWIEILAITLPAVATIASVILENTSAEEVWSIVTIIFTLITLVCAFVVLAFSVAKDKSNKQLKKEMRELIDYYCEGKRFISDNVSIDFLKKESAYKITITKKFEVLSLENGYYSFFISCDKHPESISESTTFYKSCRGIWDAINLKVNISVDRNKMSKKYENIYWEKIREEMNHIHFKAYFQQVKNGQRVAFSVKPGDVVTITYSFVAKTQYWGSYINRKIHFHGTETSVDLIGIKQNMCTVLIIDMDGRAEVLEGCKMTEQDNVLRIVFPSNLPLSKVKTCFFRVYWDANSIFDNDGLNSCFVGASDPFLKIYN